MPTLPWLTTDVAILGLTLGIGLIYVELNRPGRVLPGATGLLIALISIAALIRQHPDPQSIFLFLLAAGVLLVELFRGLPPYAPLASALLLLRSFYHLPAHGWFHLLNALVCAAALSFGTSYLAGIARRARASKRLD